MVKNNKKNIATGVIIATTLAVTTVSNINKSNTIKELIETKTKLEQSNAKANKENIEIKKSLQNEIDQLNDKIKKQQNDYEKLEKENANLKKELSSLRKFELTYYTSLPRENGGYTTTAIQTKLRSGVIASNYYSIGTKISIGGKVYIVEDRGGSEFNSPNRLDVLIERNAGESDSEYYKRVSSMGRKHVIGKIL